MTVAEIELAVASHLYPPRSTLLLPNASWGFGLDWEADLVTVTKAGFIGEIEIKVSVSDFKADFKKKKHALLRKPGCRVSAFSYAMPERIWRLAETEIDEKYGLITCIKDRHGRLLAKWRRRPKKLNANRATEKHINSLYRLGYLRMWDLKRNIYRNSND